MTAALGVSAALTLMLYLIPNGELVVLPLVWLSTLAHELGHGLTAVALGGHFGHLEIYMDASGVAYTDNEGVLADALVSAGGLVGPSLVAAACFLAARSPKASRAALSFASAFLLAVAAIWVRNVFGVVYVVGLAFVLATVVVRLKAEGARFVTAFLGVQLSLSVFSRSDYLFVPVAQTQAGPMPSDVARIAEVLWLPYWVWGGLCGLFSLVVLGGGLWLAVWGASPAPEELPATLPRGTR